MTRKRILILGSTGSIGVSTLDVARDFQDRFEVVGLSGHSNIDLLVEQAREFQPQAIALSDPAATEEGASRLREAAPGADIVSDAEAPLAQLVRDLDADILVVATVGFAGLTPTLEGIRRGMTIALANKEVLVVGGELVMRRAREAGVDILPIDSEHNAVFQCLAGNNRESVRRVVLTASGGPFRDWPDERIEHVTPEEALRHPTWDMGPKITIDCATLMNKGLEVIEACHLFGMRPDQVDVVIHPQSTVHSMVEYADGSVLAQLGQTNMYLPILNVLSYPDRLANRFEPLDLASLGRLDFSHPDRKRFPCLDYAYEAIGAGGSLPAAMNAANEIAVGAFLDGKIPFTGIGRTIRHVMDRHRTSPVTGLETLRSVDGESREQAAEFTRSQL